MSLTPKETQCFYAAHKIRREQIDDASWVMGMYMLRAVSVALDHGFNGRKARSNYFDKPLMTDIIQSEKPKKSSSDGEDMSEEEIQRKRDQLVNALSVMMYNAKGAEIAKKKALESSRHSDSEVDANGIVNQSTDNA